MLIPRKLSFFILLNIGCRKINTGRETGFMELSMDMPVNCRDSGCAPGFSGWQPEKVKWFIGLSVWWHECCSRFTWLEKWLNRNRRPLNTAFLDSNLMARPDNKFQISTVRNNPHLLQVDSDRAPAKGMTKSRFGRTFTRYSVC